MSSRGLSFSSGRKLVAGTEMAANELARMLDLATVARSSGTCARPCRQLAGEASSLGGGAVRASGLARDPSVGGKGRNAGRVDRVGGGFDTPPHTATHGGPGRTSMTLTRRQLMGAAAGTAAAVWLPTAHAQASALKISHQFPGGTIDRRRLPRPPVPHVSPPRSSKRSGGELEAEIYPNSSLIKTNAQFSAMRKGALDISL